ncbi:hypothetical protein HG536_0E03880 [Torulaspora globosa]|uniref:Low temperature viability protein n=1 Tax=Torulaspora globosa TaxID=48254 RepID=A0A7G3ZIZ1_9SACH|nr:uncharacterized protein HG536_0E03880 [Torulaspora globosa]QLL33477.1 hypothetical protein HG536_0E03880 [Torulaspora globosa]
MSKRFSKKNAQKYVVVHRPHDDPHYYDSNATDHVLVPVASPGQKPGSKDTQGILERKSASQRLEKRNEHLGEAALYGITFDDSKYDYTQHLRPIGRDPENSFFIPAKTSEPKKKSLDDLLVEPRYGDEQQAAKGSSSVFQRGIAKPEYLLHQQEVPEEISGFRPDLNPALREVLEALEDEAYVVNDDIVVKKSDLKTQEGASEQDNEEDDIFAELLESGQAEDAEAFADQLDEWDVDNLGDYEEEQYHEELATFANVENLEDLRNLDYQADVRRFQKQQKQANDTDGELEELESLSPELEDQDVLGDLPSFAQKAGKKRKERRKKGAMSDVSGFSMTSSAIARTETMTVLDDKYDQIISGYENYQEEQLEDEDNYQPFDMSKERPDFESMLDDFLDNYELDSGGRKLVKKDEEIDRLKRAADEVSKGKLSQRRNRERNNKAVNKITNTLSALQL